MPRLIKFCAAALMLFSAATLSAQESDARNDERAEASVRTITQIRFEGLKKTKESYMQELLGGCIGTPAGELDLQQIETELHAEGIFSEINIELVDSDDGENAVLSVRVKEKITFLPLPFLSYSSDGLMGGFMLMNMNAFGKKNVLLAGGIFSKTLLMGQTAFQKPAGDLAHPGISAAAGFSHKNEEIVNAGGSTVYDLEGNFVNAALSITEKITPAFSINAGISYHFCDITSGGLDSVHQWQLFSGWSYSVRDWNGWFLSSSGIRFQGDVGLDENGSFTSGLSLAMTMQKPLLPRLRISCGLSGSLEEGRHPALMQKKNSVGSTILRTDFRSPKMAAAEGSLECAVFRAKKAATVSLYGSYEAAAAEDADGTPVFCHGPGAGLLVYLSQVAFPACKVGFSYNVPQNLFQFVIGIGMGF